MRRKQHRGRNKPKEQGLDSKNAFGVSDPTPKQAIRRMLRDRSSK